MTSSFPDLIEVDEDDPATTADLRMKVLPSVDDVAAASQDSSRIRKRSLLDSILCRRRTPSVKDTLAVIGLKKALLVGMLSNLERPSEDMLPDIKTDDQLAQAFTAALTVDAAAKSDAKSAPLLRRPHLRRPAHSSFADSSIGSTSMSSSEDNTTPPHEAPSAPAGPSAPASSSSCVVSPARLRLNLSSPPPTNDKQQQQSSEAFSSSDSSSFATLMFARDAPRMRARDMLHIPLSVPPANTPPPQLKYTIAGVRSSDVQRRRHYQRGRSHISIHSSSSETLLEGETPGRPPPISITSTSSSDPAWMRRHSHAVSPTDASSIQQQLVSSSSTRRFSVQPDRLQRHRTAQTEIAMETGASSDVVTATATAAGMQLASPLSASLPSVEATRVRAPYRRQVTLQVPQFQYNYSANNRLQVPVPVGGPGAGSEVRPSRPQPSKQPTSPIVARRRLRAQQLKRQKSFDAARQYDSADDSVAVAGTSAVGGSSSSSFGSFGSFGVASHQVKVAALCAHCARSVEHLDRQHQGAGGKNAITGCLALPDYEANRALLEGCSKDQEHFLDAKKQDKGDEAQENRKDFSSRCTDGQRKSLELPDRSHPDDGLTAGYAIKKASSVWMRDYQNKSNIKVTHL